MPFDPTLPANRTRARASEMRAQFNALNDQNTATNQRVDQNEADDAATNARIDQTNADVAAANQRIDNLPPPIATNPLIATGRIISDNGDLTIANADPNGSSEQGVRLTNNSGRLLIARRENGMDQDAITLDLAGRDDGGGSPSVQDGDLFKYDGTSQTVKPTRGVTQTLVVADGSGGTHTLQIVGGLIVGVT